MPVKNIKSMLRSVAATASLLVCCASAHAGLVDNGGFETQDFSGWNASIDSVWDGVDGQSPQSGNYSAFFGSSSTSTISQTLSTIAGRTYYVSFWLKNEEDVNGVANPNSFQFAWDGTTVLAVSDESAFDYKQYGFFVDATGATTDLSFSFIQQVAFWDFDSVDVHIPEPNELALAGLAGALAFFASKRRRREEALPDASASA